MEETTASRNVKFSPVFIFIGRLGGRKLNMAKILQTKYF